MHLRHYQEQIIEQTREAYRKGFKAPLIVSPTGSGKTVMFSYITQSTASKQKRVIILCHRVELIEQISAALTTFNVSHGVIAAGYPDRLSHPVQIASVFTLIKRIGRIPEPHLIVIDEAHHCTKKTTWGRVLQGYPRARVLGVTATPIRMGGNGLGDIFDTMILGPSTQELITMGALSPIRIFAPPTINTDGLHVRGGDYVRQELVREVDKPTITGDSVSHYGRICPNAAAIAFCVSREHARNVSQGFRAGGFRSASIDGSIDREVRRDIVQDFIVGRIQVLTSCDLISEGFDCPRVEAGIFLRPTQSLGLWLQQCGRILRPYPGKNSAILLDHAGNTSRHGLPTDDRQWELAVRGNSGAKRDHERPQSFRICGKCFAATRGPASVCGECQSIFPVESRTMETLEGELVELTPEQIKANAERKQARMEQGMSGYEQLIAIGKRNGYKSPERWAQYVIRGRQAKKSRASDRRTA